ncbi:hypothetical protein ACFQJ5_10070 [Halomicroarcula sp. GCM10025324]|uniref:hypothetical protein n=1 Tax=Haloarcula TaxID=2237 RepID=UPI0023E8FAEB|nr:hypothetical protein [Halomicroarcula sp. ZS-22-S1]
MVAALGAKAISFNNSLKLADYSFYIGTGLLSIGIVGWFVYDILRRFEFVDPAPEDLEELSGEINTIDSTLNDLNDRIDHIEHQIQKRDLNSTQVQITSDSGDITVRSDLDAIQ